MYFVIAFLLLSTPEILRKKNDDYALLMFLVYEVVFTFQVPCKPFIRIYSFLKTIY